MNKIIYEAALMSKKKNYEAALMREKKDVLCCFHGRQFLLYLRPD